MSVTEISIKVPWGIIAAKTWGLPTNPPVLAVHGLQDNAGTFDRLMPLLPQTFYYVCVDLPGHGKSSHFPPHSFISLFDWVKSLKYVVENFQWKSFIYMAHSLGVHIGFYFAATYPEYIEKLISLDAIAQFPVSAERLPNYLHSQIETLIKIERKVNNNSAPTYTYDEAFDRIKTNRLSTLTDEAVKPLLDRMLVPANDNGAYNFSMDQRLKCFLRMPVNSYYLTSIIKHNPFRFPHLIIMAKESVLLGLGKQFAPVIKELKKNRFFRYVEVNGNHDVHNNFPERVAPIIEKFLLKQKSKL